MHLNHLGGGGGILVEEFISGTQHSFSTFIYDQKVYAYFSDNEFSTVNPYTVSLSSYPSDNVEIVKNQLIQTSEEIAKKLQLVDGVLHHQYIYSNGKTHILEITRRCSGDWYSEPVKDGLGIPWAELIVRASMGVKEIEFKNVTSVGYGGRYCIQSETNGEISHYEISSELGEYIVDSIKVVQEGEVVTNHLNQKLYILVFRFPSKESMAKILGRLNNLAKVIIKDSTVKTNNL